MTSLSVIIIAKNEAHNIVDYVHSCSFADEVIVLDSGSTDGTVELARQAGAQVYETDWPGFGPQKQRALTKARSDWVMSIDADERIEDLLRNEILHTIKRPEAEGYRMPRLSSFCGQFIYHSGWRPDRVLRLAKREHALFSDHLVHERMIVKGRIKDLKNDLIHHSYRDWADVMDKMDRYSTAGAQQLLNQQKPSLGLGAMVLHASWAFFRTYILRMGLLDGGMGFNLAIYNAQCTYYKYLKHREMCFKIESERLT
mgnify:CR=1 FL=1